MQNLQLDYIRNHTIFRTDDQSPALKVESDADRAMLVVKATPGCWHNSFMCNFELG